jgi:hypothetical protein
VHKAQVAGESHTRLECRSSLYYQQSALYPIVDLFQRLLQAPPYGALHDHLERLEQPLASYHFATAEAVPLFATSLSLLPADRYAPLALSPEQQRHKTLEALLAFVLTQTAQQPVLFILEDLHWTDPSTLAWRTLLIEQAPTASILTLLTCRQEFQEPCGGKVTSDATHTPASDAGAGRDDGGTGHGWQDGGAKMSLVFPIRRRGL